MTSHPKSPRTTGNEAEEAPVKENSEQFNLDEQTQGLMYTPQDIDTMVQKAEEFSFPYEELMPEPKVPTYEEMMFQDMLNCGPSSMETQPDLEQVEVQVLDIPADLKQVALQEYLMEESRPLHTSFVLPNQGKTLSYTCPMYFGSFENKQKVLDTL